MGETSKVRRKPTSGSERINLDDWGGANALDGLLSFLNIKPEDAPVNHGSAKVLNLISDRQSGTVPHIDAVPDSNGLPSDVLPSALIEDPPPQSPSPCIDRPPVTGTVPFTKLSQSKQISGFGNKKIYRCILAQDGHSHTEEALYQLLWRSGKPDHDENRVVIMGYGEMSKRVRLSFNNTKAACQRLIVKLALEEVAREISDIRQGKTYRVYSYRAILERRKQNGLEWVIRNKGVEFISKPLTAILGTVPVIDTDSLSGMESLSITGRGTGSIKGTLLEKSLREKKRESTSTDKVQAVTRALSRYGQPDDLLTRALIDRCKMEVQDCAIEEIIHFIHEKGSLVLKDAGRRIANPMGFLLTAVPRCFIGETFHIYREQERELQEQERDRRKREDAEIEQWRREQQAILTNPEVPEDEKILVRQILGQT